MWAYNRETEARFCLTTVSIATWNTVLMLLVSVAVVKWWNTLLLSVVLQATSRAVM